MIWVLSPWLCSHCKNSSACLLIACIFLLCVCLFQVCGAVSQTTPRHGGLKQSAASFFFSSICHLSGLDRDNISLHQSVSAGAEPRLGTRISRRLNCSHVLLVGETFIGTWLEHPYGASLGGPGFSQHGDYVPRLSRGRWKPYCLS